MTANQKHTYVGCSGPGLTEEEEIDEKTNTCNAYRIFLKQGQKQFHPKKKVQKHHPKKKDTKAEREKREKREKRENAGCLKELRT
jgi:hypothetical protein